MTERKLGKKGVMLKRQSNLMSEEDIKAQEDARRIKINDIRKWCERNRSPWITFSESATWLVFIDYDGINDGLTYCEKVLNATDENALVKIKSHYHQSFEQSWNDKFREHKIDHWHRIWSKMVDDGDMDEAEMDRKIERMESKKGKSVQEILMGAGKLFKSKRA